MNGKPKRPAYETVRTLIANGGAQYTDDSLREEIAYQERKRGPMSEKQRSELLELATAMRDERGEA